jgi:hypothetical protein
VAVKNSINVSPLVFLNINVCNHGEHYEMPCISSSTKNLNTCVTITPCQLFLNIQRNGRKYAGYKTIKQVGTIFEKSGNYHKILGARKVT